VELAMQKFYAQFGEDRLLYNLFNKKKDGVCVEVGGYDGITGSNTYFFEGLGWQCLIIEPMPDFCKKIIASRKSEVIEVAASDVKGETKFYIAEGVETLSTMKYDTRHFERIFKDGANGIREILVQTDLLDSIFQLKGFSNIDFLTLDVEGNEMSALRGMSFDNIRPRILIIEDGSFGANSEVYEFMLSKNYVRFRRTGCNDWYADRNDQLVTWPSILRVNIEIKVGLFWRQLKGRIKNVFF
jgi:FkbM family methyltransferase